jgi:hypothetical protein
VSRATDLAYFDHLTSPDWIEALQKQNSSNRLVSGSRRRLRQVPNMGSLSFLARVAPLAPERVFSVIRQLPHSDNPRVHEDIAQAASAMPVELARKLVSQIRHWVETDRHLLLLPTRVVELAGHLARSGASDDAIELARSLLALSVDEDIIGQRIRTRVSDHDFVDLLQDLAEPLIAAAPDAALRLFIDLLDHALSERYTAPPTSSRRFDDASIIWRPDIGDERDAEARFQPILNSLVDAVVRAARATNDVNDVDPFDLLQGARASVFGRIELQLLAGLSNPCAPNLVSRLLVSRSQLSNQTLELEYLRALRSKADQLTPGQGRRLAKWIRIGPLRAGFLAKRFGDEWPGYLAIWQARRLAALGVAIPVEDTVWASPLVSQIEPSALEPHRPPTVASWIGPSSPRRPEDLAVLSPRELVSFLSEWTPTGEWATPSPEGLGRALTQAIAKHPMRFSKSALEFVGLEPAYVRSVLAGLREGLKQGHRISWSPVVGLATWVVNQPVGQLERDWIHDDRDPGWDWTWTEIGRLLDEGLTDRTNRIPRSMVGQVRFLALRLIDHSDPTPESEAQYGGSNMEPHASINTTRGTAAHTLVRLAGGSSKCSAETTEHRRRRL